ncbi:MAG: hypothetical protein KF715_01340 [Candidatus Didemnitutus sp.]|nr:hypothetical protein [Candidatus Didemnitutus sp.]
MQLRYPREALRKIIEQAMVYQCACPAQVCKAIGQMRELHKYQQECLIDQGADRSVHERIALAAAKAHAELEQCLADVLRLEGWNAETLEMPSDLAKRRRAP